MYLCSQSNQTVVIPKASLSLKLFKNELIHTENSYKFTISQIDTMFEKADLDIIQLWFDAKKYFVLILAKRF